MGRYRFNRRLCGWRHHRRFHRRLYHGRCHHRHRGNGRLAMVVIAGGQDQQADQ
ncbi:hypothetical protein C3B79_1273 [Aeromonas hydrophila]|nr:hypothetical protein C3B79_1273 [Aeromonas hydrophila]